MICSPVVFLQAQSGQNLVRNPGFEITRGNMMPAEWALSAPRSGSLVERSDQPGKYCVMLSAGQANKNQVYWIQRNLPIKAGVEYLASFQVKGEAGQQYRVYLETDNPWKGTNSSWKTATGDWERQEFKFKFTACNNRPWLVLGLKAPGKIYFDDLSITEASANSAVTAGTTGNPAATLVLNGNFQQLTAGWQLQDGAKLAQGIAPEGGNCVRLSSATEGNDPGFSQSGIRLLPGRRYRLSYQVKAEKTVNGTGFQRFKVYMTPERNGKNQGDEWLDVEQTWQRKSLYFDVPVHYTGSWRITAQLQGPGTVDFSDFELKLAPRENADTPLKIIVKTPYYRNTIFGGTPQSIIAGTVELSRKQVSTVEISLKSNSTGEEVFTQSYRAEPLLDFCIPAPGKDGEYVLSAIGKSTDGKNIARYQTIISKLPKAGTEITVRDDNMLLVNGSPFFVIGMWAMPGTERGMYEMAKNGVNTLCSFDLYGVNTNMLDIAATCNLKVIDRIAERLPLDPNDPQRQKIEARSRGYLERISGHPALLAHILADEPAWGGVPVKELLASYQFHRQLDPYHPIYINEAPRNKIEMLSDYAAACDIDGVDIYPLSQGHSEMDDKSISCVGKYTDKMRLVVNDRKPIWMTLQGFSGAHVNNPKDNTSSRYPTYAESRFMAFDAIVHGATGVLYWGVYKIVGTDYWETLFKVTRELRDLSTVLAARSVQPSPVKSAPGAISFIHKKLEDGSEFIIAVNGSAQSVSAVFKTPFQGSTVNVAGENRTTALNAGAFSDRFKPYDIHVYSTTATLPPPLVAAPAGPEPEGLIDFIELARFRQNARAYQGKAQWIWFPGKHNKPDQRTFFRRVFEVNDSTIDTARLYIACDDYAKVYVNGDFICKATGWNVMTRFDITRSIKPGKNVIAVEAFSKVPPGGLIAEVKINGKSSTFTDTSWLATQDESADWNTSVLNDNRWKKAEIIGPVGTAPWHYMLILE